MNNSQRSSSGSTYGSSQHTLYHSPPVYSHPSPVLPIPGISPPNQCNNDLICGSTADNLARSVSTPRPVVHGNSSPVFTLPSKWPFNEDSNSGYNRATLTLELSTTKGLGIQVVNSLNKELFNVPFDLTFLKDLFHLYNHDSIVAAEDSPQNKAHPLYPHLPWYYPLNHSFDYN